MPPPVRRLLVTGAAGYIGRRLVALARERGLEVVAAVRGAGRRRDRPGLSHVEFDLAASDDPAPIVAGVDAVVHLAAILDEAALPPGAVEDRNVSGTRRLLEAARAARVGRFVFASSHSAAPGGPTRYGRSKWAIERLLEGEREIAVRLGLVSGGPARGVFGQLLRACERAPLLPAIRPAAPVYPVHLDDACRALLAVATAETPPGRAVWVGADEPMRFADYLRLVARERLGRRLPLVPVPASAALLACRIGELLPFGPALSGERVRGLIALSEVDVRSMAGLAEVGVARTDLARALAAEGRRRRLAAEGRALATYATGRPAEPGVVRRYVRAVTSAADARPLDLPATLLRWPRLLRLVEPGPAAAERFRERLDRATRIAEMTPRGAQVFHRYAPGSRLAAWASLGGLAVVEAILLVLRPVFGRILFGRR